eukprot:g6680.t1
MKRGVGHSESSSSGPPGKRRSSRGAALLAAAGSPPSAVQTDAANRTSRRTPSTTNGAVHLPGEAVTAVKQKGPGAATSAESRSGPSRRSKTASDAAVAPRQRGGVVSSTATSRSTKGVRKGAGASPSLAAAAAAAAGSTPSSSSLPAAAASKSSKKGRSGGGRDKGKASEAAMSADSDVARKMLASLLSPASAATEDYRSETHQRQSISLQGWGGGGASAVGEGFRGGGEEVDPHPCPLEAMFLALEQVLPLFRRRRQATLLKQVRPAVEGMCGRSFTRQHLAQIVHVQPDAYRLSSRTDARPTRGGYRLRDLLIEIGPSSTDRAEGGARDDSPKRETAGAAAAAAGGERGAGGNDEAASSSSGTRNNDGSGGRGGRSSGGGTGRGEGEAVSARRREVFLRLLASARAQHCKCGRPGGDGKKSSNPRDRGCLCLPEASLPDTTPLSAEGTAGGGGGSVGSVGEAHGQRSRPVGLSCGGIVAAAGLAGREDYDVEGSNAPKNVEALRERLRLKDAQGALERNKTAEEKEADRRRKGNLPAVADAVRSFFARSGRATCSLDALVEALSSSSKHAMSRKEARDRVKMLAGLVPEWCTIIAPRANGGGVLGGVDSGMVARPTKAREVVRLNTRIRFDEVRQMIVFMAGGVVGASQ